MLTVAQQTKRSPETGDFFMPVQLVAGLAPTLSAALAPSSLIAPDLGSTGCPRLIRPDLSKSHRPHFGIGHAGFGDQTSQLAPLAAEASIKKRTRRRRA